MTSNYLRVKTNQGGGATNSTGAAATGDFGNSTTGGGAADWSHKAPNIRINYDNLPFSEGVKLVVIEAENTKNISPDHLIDRKVTFRTTEGTAGPYGSLNKFQTITDSSSAPYTDSLPRQVYDMVDREFNGKAFEALLSVINGEICIDLDKEMYQDYLMVHFRDRYNAAPKLPQKAIVRSPVPDTSTMVATPALPIKSGKTTRDDAIYSPIDDSGNNVVFKSNTNVNPHVELLDYIRDKFPLSDSKQKIFNDLAGGFGNGPQGRLLFRPSLFEHKAYSSSNLTGLVTHYFLKMDPVRGARFGLMNTNPQRRNFVYSRSSFGQARDLFEQPLDTQISGDTNDPITGCPVVFDSKNPKNPSIDLPVHQNTRRNRDRHQRIAYPVFDVVDGYYNQSDQTGLIPPTNVNSLPGPDLSGVFTQPETQIELSNTGQIQPMTGANPSLTVNVAGALKTSAQVAPGNIRDTAKRGS